MKTKLLVLTIAFLCASFLFANEPMITAPPPTGPLTMKTLVKVFGADAVKAPTIVKRIEPVYPDMAKKSGIGGIVILGVVIDTTGHVQDDVEVLKPLDGGFSEAAVEAVKQWKYKPATVHGQPVDVIFNVTINFLPRSK